MENKVLSFTSEELASSLDSVFSCCLIRGIKNRYRWNNNTADDYRKIVSLFTKAIKKETGKTAFNQITLQDYDAALKSQCEAYRIHHGKELKDSTIRKRKTVIAHVTSFVESNNRMLYADPLRESWGKRKKRKIRKRHGERERGIDQQLRVPRSLTIKTEAKFAKQVYDNRLKSSGVYIGGLIMLFLGLRPGECCGLKYDDIKRMNSESDTHIAYINEQEEVSRGSHSRLKNKNAYRALPIPTTLLQFINERKKMIMEKQGLSADEISEYPIANAEGSYSDECPRDRFSAKITELLRRCNTEIDINGYSIEDSIKYAQETINANKEVQREKEPTTYVLRRNFATVMLGVCGISGDELKYLMGHELLGKMKRSEFLDEEMMEELRRKMDKRHLLDRFPNQTVAITDNEVNRQASDVTIHTKDNAARIDAFRSCAEDALRVEIKALRQKPAREQKEAKSDAPRTISMKVTYIKIPNPFSRERIDISDAYRRAMIASLDTKTELKKPSQEAVTTRTLRVKRI